MTQHTNTHNCMPVHVLMEQSAHRTHANAHKHPCTCACSKYYTRTPRYTRVHSDCTSLEARTRTHPPLLSPECTEHPQTHSPHADTHRQSTLHALTHSHTLSAQARMPGAVYSAAWSEETVGSQPDTAARLGSRDRHAPHPTTEPLFTPSPAAPHTLRQKEHR